MEDVRDYLAKVYELLRAQQETLFQQAMKIRSLEMALDTNQSFAELRQQTTLAARVPAEVKEYELALRAIDLLIQQLRGDNPKIADA
jgi:hypothetical protein